MVGYDPFYWNFGMILQIKVLKKYNVKLNGEFWDTFKKLFGVLLWNILSNPWSGAGAAKNPDAEQENHY